MLRNRFCSVSSTESGKQWKRCRRSTPTEWRDIQVVTQRWDPHVPKSSEDSVGAVSAETGARSSSDTKTGPHVERVRKTVPTRRHSSPTEWWISQLCNSELVLTVRTAHVRPWRTHRSSSSTGSLVPLSQKLFACSFFSVQVLVGDSSYSRGGRTERP